ncbi:MAG: FAD-dependent oxidoreductase [Chromatiales bacterium]|jgi:nitrite reductase (NADH) large subunit
MLPQTSSEIALYPEPDILPVIVIGAGPVGVRVVLELCRHLPECPVHLFSGEPWAPQRRFKLNSVLTSEIDQAELSQNISLSDKPHVVTHFNEYVVGIDRQSRTITTRYGNRYEYRRLILATGSDPNVPRIPGIGLAGVYTFRDMTDTDQLYTSMTRSRHTAVIGGGLLGLEAAKAMRRFNTRVTVIEHSAHLLFQQLDARGAGLLKSYMESLGIRVHTNEGVRQILGGLTVQGIELRSGVTFKCDTIILAAGVQPNIELACEAGLATGRGILVNDRLQTSDPLIYAVGECIEHRGVISGLVAPGYEQAYVVARAIADRPACYTGSISVTSLKVAGYPIFSMGDVRESHWQGDEPTFCDQSKGIYRKLVIERDRLVGVVAVGEWSEIPRLRDMIYNHRRLMPWQLWRFHKNGRIWRDEGTVDLLGWPISATLCNCTGISLARLHRELGNGAGSLEQLTAATGAGSVCGACKPLLSNLIDCVQSESDANWRTLAGISLVIVVLTLSFLLPVEWSAKQHLQEMLPGDWNSRWYALQLVTGYCLVVAGLLLALLSRYKRISSCNWKNFEHWRAFHITLGFMTVLILMLHTGLHTGQGSSLWLMLNFTGLLLSGALLGGLYGLKRWLPIDWVRRSRYLSLKAHLLLLWPLPLLVGMHITKVFHI